MTRPKDNPFAPTLERFEDFLDEQQARNVCSSTFRIVSEDGSFMQISNASLRQFVDRHRELGERIARFRNALKELQT